MNTFINIKNFDDLLKRTFIEINMKSTDLNFDFTKTILFCKTMYGYSLTIVDTKKKPGFISKASYRPESNIFEIEINNRLYDENFFKDFDLQYGTHYQEELRRKLDSDDFIYYDVQLEILKKILDKHIYEVYLLILKDSKSFIESVIQSSEYQDAKKLFEN